ncbi:hypothetical protein HPP92_009915 [Vanilla planifolia]|uniref:Uncharacterized protein n=1 Tax=Vanilla planifolia TaxID=51239 RepID=A0A835RAZ9_VANPL|nr:hypothetical protein HPP92_009915 [Vanilla planifolia]
MRREGRQHGKVLTTNISYLSEKPSSKQRSMLEAPVLCGNFVKAPSKPTNRSRFTSRCSRPRCHLCHDHPVNKSRAKTKGMHKHSERYSSLLEEGYRIVLETREPIYVSDDGGEETEAEGASHGVEPAAVDRSDGGASEDGEWVMVESDGRSI